ncbi:MAG: bifunctional indole-3-glycerol-phosphate synthase TrpC/phosphoribosylanthranilate isomerase TrpF [Pseudomonadota bacterium]|nr:bifunctional indole-3-glycerol-phosphate synthase TrpC/phosphoribosylanthranilate isomerase TrpF [Pseudomonadota bacterium]
MTEPAGILAEIAASKRTEIARRFDGVAIDAMRAQAARTALSLEDALARPGARFIFEIKKASPSAGVIRAAADVAAIARGYDRVADALSVLIDSPRFDGSLADLAVARTAFSGPILAKDFFLVPEQVVEARLHGADAVLAMLSLLDDEAARAIIAEARRFGMDVLVEVHDKAEMDRALALGATLIGINNRDFRDLSVDLATTERLAPLARGRTLVCESGISRRSDIDRLSGLVDGFLVGSALMRSTDPAEAGRTLAFGRVKLCGLNRLGDIEAGRPATFAGLVLVPESPRAVTAAQAKQLADIARLYGIKPVGIFRNSPTFDVVGIARSLALHAVQLHGHETTADIAALRAALPEDCEIWTAIDASETVALRGGDRTLFDNGTGGGGKAFDWKRVAGHPALACGIIAGGIGPDNVRAASALGAYAVDVGSAVDEAPGRKDPAKIAALFEAVRSPSRQELLQCA